MDLPQLKLLAERVRALLQQSGREVGHNQSLDLIAALPGLRNWPEVMAFPDRVVACELDSQSASRLSFRLNKRHGLALSAHDLLAALRSAGTAAPSVVPALWPTGPKPGLYVTCSPTALDALLASYEEATDGALTYTERAGTHWEGSIDLGESGLWSNGIARVPSGTLIVVGPIKLHQQLWDDSARHLEMAAIVAQAYDHRVVALIDTPAAETVCEDVQLMIESVMPENDDLDTALMGIVTETGELEERAPFSRPRPKPVRVPAIATTDAIPDNVLPALQAAVSGRNAGLMLFGSSAIAEHTAFDLACAALALTEHAGPAARIMPRHRSTPSKDWLVPDPIKQLPYLPSIESAYEQGYRRMILTTHYMQGRTVIDYCDRVLFIGATYCGIAAELFMSLVRFHEAPGMRDILDHVIAILGVNPLPGKRGPVVASDLYVAQSGPLSIPEEDGYEEFRCYVNEKRVVRREDELARLLDSEEINVDTIKEELRRDRDVAEFLARYIETRKATIAPQ